MNRFDENVDGTVQKKSTVLTVTLSDIITSWSTVN